RTIPLPRTYTSVFAVPRSTAMSRPRNVSALLIGNGHLPIRSEPWRGKRRKNFSLNVDVHWGADRAYGTAPRTLIPCLTRELLNEFREEDLDFPRGGLRGVGAVNHVLPEFKGIVAANRARTGLDRVCRPGERPERLDGPLPLGDQCHDRGGGDELDQI